ncbi:NAD(P)-binding protein [Yamadazyma tenuis ATCC 10573]|uniref:NAD(P)-binding protein n=1 Tax=Candida tenuis (strain ATCC 10573 / BCRC 21748 / CBS 615 / JCM 9827 / NBRC 10315 / NRRL Y-1498 / VKM Y-70) TaxID=590646 RepID=G3B7A0_CANTC|nr:NAD(P)-binding protein [Yamadazyma tenuis ATCC 10573]EGV61606.1 NAD(P)-binding protein [Yamadazyma tenuis ATCC 10573]
MWTRTYSRHVPLSKDDVAVVVGGARGLGIEMVKQLTNKYKVKKVIIIDMNKPEVRHQDITFIPCNVGDKKKYAEVLQNVIDECEASGDKIRVFVTNAGIRHSKSVLQLSMEEIDEIYDVNVFSYIQGIRALLKHHMKHPQDSLSIVTVSSVLGILAPRNLTIYSSTKAALSQIHEGLAQELVDFPSIRMLLVLPGQLSRGMFDDDIMDRVNNGQCGVLSEPIYGKLLPVVKCLPYSIIQLCRRFSQMDQKVRDNS